MASKRKVCFVVQRYGLEVNGGAELLCRQLAEKMLPLYDIEVLTTKAVDYMTWRDEYTESYETVNGVGVHRFSVAHPRVQEEFDAINGKFMQGVMGRSEEAKWLEEQGPYVPDLIQYIREHKEDYAVFVFFTYLYYTTVMGVQQAKEKAIVISHAHDEPFLRMKQFDHVFLDPQAFFFNTDEERALIRKRYQNYDIPCKLGGVGVEIPENVSGERFRQKYHLDNYIIYVGRIDEGKNCGELFEYFIRYKKLHPGSLKLVLIGKAVIEIPKHEDIISLGFVSDEDKFNGIAGSQFLVLPSVFESLSMVVLEAFSLGRPVLVNGKCEVLRGHCEKCGGGFYYRGFGAFESKMLQLLNFPELQAEMGEKGRAYVQSNFQWSIIIKKFASLIEYVAARNRK